MSEVLNSPEAALSAVTSAIAAFSPSAEAPAADVGPAYSEGVSPIVREAPAKTTTPSFVFEGQKYSVRFDSASTSSADEVPVTPVPEPSTDPTPEYIEACADAAIEGPRNMYLSRQGRHGIDPFESETLRLPAGIVSFDPVRVDGKICDPTVVDRIYSLQMLVGKLPERMVFKGFWLSSDNQRAGSGTWLPNQYVNRACARAEKRNGRDKGEVALTLAVLTLADSNGKIEQSDPAELHKHTRRVRCEESRHLTEQEVTDTLTK